MSTSLRQPRKVLHVFNGAGGGAALSTIGLIESFRAQGIEACAVCHEMGSQQERDILFDALDGQVLFAPLYWWNHKIRAKRWKRPLIELRQLLKTRWMRRSAAQVTEFAHSQGADLIHTNTILTPEGGLAARRLGLPHVWHLRELVGPGNAFRLQYEGPALGRYLATHCSKLIANSQVTAAQVRDWLPADLLEVIPNGIDLARFRSRANLSHRETVVVAMVGDLHSRSKNHALFIEAVARLDRSLPLEFRIYGRDPSLGGKVHGDAYVAQLHQLIESHGLQSRFRWPGFVADPACIMSEIDVLVHPAEGESFGRVVVEAMAASLPVVGVRGGGVGEIIAADVTGLVAKPNDPGDLAGQIDRLVRDVALRGIMGFAGRQRAELNYSLAACAAQVLRVYGDALALPLANC